MLAEVFHKSLSPSRERLECENINTIHSFSICERPLADSPVYINQLGQTKR
jgi:hypothetical protein